MRPQLKPNFQVLALGYQFLEKLLRASLGGDSGQLIIPETVERYLADLVEEPHLKTEEGLCLLLGLAPHLQPHLIDQVVQEVLPQAGNFPLVGGQRTKQRTFVPTGETLLFFVRAMQEIPQTKGMSTGLVEQELYLRQQLHLLFREEHFFKRKGLLRLEDHEAGDAFLAGKVLVSEALLQKVYHGSVSPPAFSSRFPAETLRTELSLEEVSLNEAIVDQLNDIIEWIRHGESLQRDAKLGKYIKKGYRALFLGPPGVGKSLTAAAIGKASGTPVLRVDLSQIVSKYIGETEKNLSNLFAQAEHQNWILFFDEADALFGKRTNVKDAHDRYANQETAYLLQRIENYNGLIIMASNMRSNIEEAFFRRFQSIIHFPFPVAEERLRIWQQALPHDIQLDQEVSLAHLAKKYRLTGAAIVNVLHFSSLKAKINNPEAPILREADILAGIQQEMSKEGRILKYNKAG